MGLDTNFNQDPYFDDYDEDKNYHRVLFKPAVAVQARELTQLQTILQNQVERFGDNILKEGTIVKGCNFNYLNALGYVKILDLQTDLQPVIMSSYIDARAVGETTGVEAKVLLVSTGLESQIPALNTLHVRYVKSNGSFKEFSSTEDIRIENFDTASVITTVTAAGTVDPSNSVGLGVGLTVGDGVIYQKGHFVAVDEQSIVVEKYSDVPDSIAVGFQTAETLVTSSNDTTLLDNAQGYFNENAPGADRLQLTPSLATKTVALANADDTFFTLVEYQQGVAVKRKERTQYSFIGDEMSRRTVEESGNYTVDPFRVYLDGEFDSEYLKVQIGPGLGYVGGNRIETFGNMGFPILNDANTFVTSQAQSFNMNIGNYIIVTDTYGNFQHNDLSTVYIYNAEQNGATSNTVIASNTAVGTQIGTAKVRGWEYHSGIIADDTCQYRLYLFDVRMANTSVTFVADAKAFVTDDGGGGSADIVLNANTAILQDTQFKSLVYDVNSLGVKDIDNLEFNYSTSSTATLTTNAASVSLSAGEEFTYGVGILSDTEKRDDIILVAANGALVNLDDATVNVTSATNMSLSDVNAADGTITIYYDVKVVGTTSVGAIPVTKDLNTVFVKVAANTHTNTTTGYYSLGLPDVDSIEAVYKDSAGGYSETTSGTNLDVTNQFDLYRNSRDTYYNLSYVRKKNSLTIGADDTLLFKVKVFEQSGSGYGYASVDSYITYPASPVNYEDIPVYTVESGLQKIDLRNALDFRPYADATSAYSATIGSATIATADPETAPTFTGEQYTLAPNLNTAFTYDYYLPRVDRIYIDKDGQIGVTAGEFSENPIPPVIPSGVLHIADIKVPAYPALTSIDAGRANKPEYTAKVIQRNIRGYTMRDIGKLDKRIRQLEYYTVLNQLEASAKDKLITDGEGNDRFKNGIFTDSFEDLSVADVNNVEFSAGIDIAEKSITPKIEQFDVDLQVQSSSNVQEYTGGATLSKTDVVFKQQPFATIARNTVTDFYKYQGKMYVDPEYDFGFDTTHSPSLSLDIDLVTPFVEFTEALNQFVPLQEESSEITNTENFTNRITTAGGTLVTTTTESTLTTTVRGIQTSIGEETKREVGDFVTDIRFNPYMRAKEIRVIAFGVRPETQMYFYFDEIDVNAYVAPALSSNLSDTDDLRALKRSAPYNTQITSDSDGVVRAIFRIPEETFFVGERVLEILDVSSYANVEDTITRASIAYNAYNHSVEKQGISISTKPATISVGQETKQSTSVTSASTFIANPPPPRPRIQTVNVRGFGTPADWAPQPTGTFQFCFMAGTKMKMDNSSIDFTDIDDPESVMFKNIEDVEVGDVLIGLGGNSNTVRTLIDTTVGARQLVNINDIGFFVTEDHPFAVLDIDDTVIWKSCNAEMSQEKYPDLGIKQLELGDEICSVNGVDVVESIEFRDEDADTPLYNLELTGNHTYIANGLIAHNKCFREGTKVLMEDGSLKLIENVVVGEKLLGRDGEINTVLDFHRPLLGENDHKLPHKQRMVSINGGEYSVSEDHMIFTSEGWKTPNPEICNILHKQVLENEGVVNIQSLEFGDKIITSGEPITVNTIEFANDVEYLQLYNFILSGNRTYHVSMEGLDHYDPILVHNKDPISQTYNVKDTESADNRVFITKLDLYFSTKDADLGVTIDIREVVNGYPSAVLLPYGSVHLKSNEVNADAVDASEATTVTFPSPVTLSVNKEYAIVIKPDGDNPNYTVWVAKVGGTDVLQNIAITQDTDDGTLFTSTNDRAWTPRQDENLKYTLYRADFSQQSGSITFKNKDAEYFTVNTVSETFQGDEYVWKTANVVFDDAANGNLVELDNHGFANDSRVKFITINTTTGISVDTDYYVINKNDNDFQVSTTLAGASVDMITDGTGTLVAGGTINVQQGNTIIIGTDTNFTGYLEAGKHMVFRANTTHYDVLEILSVSNNTYLTTKDVPKYSNTVGYYFRSMVGNVSLYDPNNDARLYLDNSTAYGASAGQYFAAGDILNGEDSRAVATIQTVDNRNISFVAPNIYRSSTMNTWTGISGQFYNSDASSLYTASLEFDRNNYLNKNKSIVKSRSNEWSADAGTRSFDLTVTLDSNQAATPRYGSPFIDLDLASVKMYKYDINNVTTNEDTTAGSSTSKYISKIITLSDGMDAEDLKVYLTAYRPPDSDMHIYGKFMNSLDPADFSSKPWTLMTGKTTNPYSSVDNRYSWREFEYSMPTAAPVSGAAFLNSNSVFEYTDGLGLYNDYKYFAMKIVFTSAGHHRVPRVADIRAIALAA